MAKYFVPGLTKQQRSAFEQIATGNDTGIISITLEKLLAKELIEKIRYRKGSFSMYRYQVPIPVHMAWCEWCSKNVKEDNDPY